jgi:ribulose-5-phosphate 4-epimerase/fuculose-1-phosphate aldolase
MSTYVLVHGAWGGSHGWRKVRPLLQQAGHSVFTPTLTGLGERSHLATPDVNLSTHIQDVYNTLWYEDLTDIVLVGHSYGGMVVSGVADRTPERIRHLVYLDAFVPADGQSLFDLGGGPRQSAPPSDWRLPPLQSSQPLDAWHERRRAPQPRATFEEQVRLSAPIESRPFSLTYIVATGRPDPGPVFDATAERLRGNPRWTVREIAGGHSMNRTNPEGLASLLLALFETDSVNGAARVSLSYADQRQAIVSAAEVLVRSGVLSHSHHGNSSVRLPDGNSMLITGVSSLAGQSPDALAVVDLDGNLLEGKLASTSAEIVGMHAVVYKLKPEVGAVIHTHSPMVSTYAMAHQPMPVHYEGLLRMGVSQHIPVAAWGPRGSRESVANIEDALRAHPDASAVLLANHGLLAFGSDQASAARLIIALEEAAEMMLRAEHIGGSRALPPGALEQVRERMRAFA